MKFKPSIAIEKKGDFSECGVAVGARQAGVSVSGTADLLGFHAQPSVGFTENDLKKRKYPVNSGSQGENASLVTEVSGEFMCVCVYVCMYI